MPDTRPGLEIDDEGICSACRHYESRKYIDWNSRWQELEQLANKYRGCNGDYYDCIIAASSGKDSYYQIHIMKDILHMNPLIVMVNNFSWTETGNHNWNNMLKEFDVDAIQFSMKPEASRKMFKKGLEESIAMWYFDLAIYNYPLKVAVQMGIPLVIYGENINYEYGGFQKKETPSALEQIKNDVVKDIPIEEWLGDGITRKDFASCTPPTLEEIEKNKLNPIYLSYFVPWSGYEHMEFARTKGFKTLDDTGEWKREGFIEQYDQIDTIGYLTHCWFKYPKFGHFRTTDVASIWIREGRMRREDAVKLVLENDWKLDKNMLEDFLSYIDMDEKDFWKIVDKYANKDILEKVDENWRLKTNVEVALIKGEEVKG